jgi:hypothetical protein
MDHPALSLRVVRAVVALLCSLLGSSAFAYGSFSSGGAVWWWGRSEATLEYLGVSAAANARCAPSSTPINLVKVTEGSVSVPGYGWVPAEGWHHNCQGVDTDGHTYVWGDFYTVGAYLEKCPGDSTLAGGVCTCDNGFQPSGGSPQSCNPTNCTSLGDAAKSQYFTWGGNSSSFCWKGCQFDAAARGYSSSTGKSSADGWGVSPSGESCMGEGNSGNGAGVTNSPSTSGSCPAGQCPGTVNGVSVCVPCSESTTKTTETAASAPTGSTPPATSPGAPPGTTRETTETNCSGGRCTTTTRYYGSEGENLGDKVEEKEQTSFCKENPDIQMCKTSMFGGSCGGSFSCDGDAIQCAIAGEQHKRNCELFESNALSDVGAAAVAGEGIDHPRKTPAIEGLALSSRLDQSDGGLGGSCPGDQTVTISGKAVSIPLSNICDPLALLGNIAFGLAALVSIRIIFS